jgi:hypothetical protein
MLIIKVIIDMRRVLLVILCTNSFKKGTPFSQESDTSQAEKEA